MFYTDHARQRMQRDSITELEVETVLRDPDIILPARSGRKRVMKRLGGRLISVVYVPAGEGGEASIITVYAHREMRR
jgi:hypothetical protein